MSNKRLQSVPACGLHPTPQSGEAEPGIMHISGEVESVIWIEPRDKPGLLFAMMKEFVNNSNISFEGSLTNLEFYNWPIASHVETPTLKRQTVSPELDFVVIPLTAHTLSDIWKELSKKDHLVREGIIHVQIESKEKLAFGGYDNFDPECTVAYFGVSTELLEGLKRKGIIRDYRQPKA